MHRGVRELIEWVEKQRGTDLVTMNPPATAAELAEIETALGSPLPTDLRLVLVRFNGGELPNGQLLPAGIGPGSIGATIKEYAGKVDADFLSSEILLPFFRTDEGSLLAFDRGAGPVADTWPIVDFDQASGEHRLVYRTFDGFCRICVSDFTSDDFGKDFGLDQYLRKGKRHLDVENDVAAAHATVAHAAKRAGLADESLAHYLEAARCVPPLSWCDWEALKIAVLLGDERAALDAGSRLCTTAPDAVWTRRETTPVKVAEVLAQAAIRSRHPKLWLRHFDNLMFQVKKDDASLGTIRALRTAVEKGGSLPAPTQGRGSSVIPPDADIERWWEAARATYFSGHLRDEDLLLDPTLEPLRAAKPVAELLRIRRDF